MPGLAISSAFALTHAAAFAVLAALPAFADPLPVPPPGAVLVSPDGRTVISSTVCAALGAPQPVPGADYVPGVDVNGNEVAPADLPRTAPPLTLDNFPIEIDAKLAGRLGVPAAGGGYRAKAILGYVTVQQGRAYFNGAPLSEDTGAALVAACRDAKP